MKSILVLSVLLSLVSSLLAQPIKPEMISGPNHTIADADYGVALTCPEGWTLKRALRWGDQETTFSYSVAAVPEAAPNLYYRVFEVPFVPTEGYAAWLRGDAERVVKESAKTNGYALRADSMVASTVEGVAAVSWIGDYTHNGEKWIEWRTHLASVEGRVHLILNAPAEKLSELRPAYAALLASLHLTTGAIMQNLDPRIVDARRAYLAKDYQQAVTLFTAAFEKGTPRPIDLIVAAGAAARAGNKALALQWLQLAMKTGPDQNLKLVGNADFASLQDTDEWKQLVARLPSAAAMANTVTDRPLEQKLLAILEDDQKYRRQIDAVEKEFGRNSEQSKDLFKTMSEHDAANLVQIKTILDERGWVGPEVVGPRANSALFLVIQHADHATQEKYLPMMREAVKAKQASGSALALLEDRVALGEGRPQIYGSQIGRDGGPAAKYFVQALADPDHVDERRASVGLPPLADYVKHWDLTWDLEAYKKELPKLEAKLKKN